MIKKIIFVTILYFFICVKCYSQFGKVWDYKNRLYAEKKDNFYIIEEFHHKVEMETDTLYYFNDSTYVGHKIILIIKNSQLYINSKKGTRKLKLKLSNLEAIQSRNSRKEYYLKY